MLVGGRWCALLGAGGVGAGRADGRTDGQSGECKLKTKTPHHDVGKTINNVGKEK